MRLLGAKRGPEATTGSPSGRCFESCQLPNPSRSWANSVCVNLGKRLYWRRGAVSHRLLLFEKTQEARDGREAVSIQTRALMMETRLWRRKQGFGIECGFRQFRTGGTGGILIGVITGERKSREAVQAFLALSTSIFIAFWSFQNSHFSLTAVLGPGSNGSLFDS